MNRRIKVFALLAAFASLGRAVASAQVARQGGGPFPDPFTRTLGGAAPVRMPKSCRWPARWGVRSLVKLRR